MTSWRQRLFRSKGKAKGNDREAVIRLGYPLLFHWTVLLVAFGVFVFTAVNHAVLPLVVSVFFLVWAGLSWLWSWRSLRAVSCQLSLSQAKVFPGDRIELGLKVSNPKRLFLPWLEVEVELPVRLVTGRLKTASPYARERLRWTTCVSGGQEVGWKHALECKARGDYRLGPLRMRSGDAFGLFPREMVLPGLQPLMVYPRIVPLERLNLAFRELTGETAAPRSIYEDVSRTMGSRDYRHGDALKRVHWKASARHGQLQSRQYESTTGLSLLLVLDVHSFCQRDGNEEAFETAVTTVASLAYRACHDSSAVGLVANSLPEIQLPVGSGRNQLWLILEALARMGLESRLTLEEQVDRCRGSWPVGTTLVLVADARSPSVLAQARRLQRQGHYLLLVCVGEELPSAKLAGVPAISVRSIGELSQACAEGRA